MKNFKILDCTLRDGGYYTSWDFSTDLLASYFHAMKSSEIEVVELGYVSPLKNEIFGQYFYLNEKIIQKSRSLLRHDQKVAIMVNYKDVNYEILDQTLRPVCKSIDIVRFAIPPKDIKDAQKLFELTKELGCEVAVNVMYLSTYSNAPSLLDPIKEMDHLIDYLSLVDSYGSCMPIDVATSISYAKESFNCEIGFHGHDNIQMAFANAIAAINAGATWVDSTILGMGRGAGNLKSELILAYKADKYSENTNFAAVESALGKFEALREKCKWGTNLSYMLSGFNSLPQADVMNWIGKKRYSPESIVTALRSQSMTETPLDENNLRSVTNSGLNNSQICLIVGGGSSVSAHSDAISEFILRKKPTVIHSSLKNVFNLSSNTPRENSLISLVGQELNGKYSPNIQEYLNVTKGFIVTKAPRFKGSIPKSIPTENIYQTNIYSKEDRHLGPVMDIAPLAQCLGAAIELNAKNIYLVGFDGYENAMQSEQELSNEIKHLLERFTKDYPNIDLKSLTPNKYNVPLKSVYFMNNEGLR